RRLTQNVGLGAEGGEQCDRLRLEEAQLRSRLANPQRGDERGLALVFAHRLAHERGIAFLIEKVVGNLEGHANPRAELGQSRALSGLAPPKDGAGLARETKERPSLHGLQALDVGEAGLLRQPELVGLQIKALAARHAGGTRGAREGGNELGPYGGGGGRFRRGPAPKWPRPPPRTPPGSAPP